MHKKAGRSLVLVLALLMTGCDGTPPDRSTADAPAPLRLPPIPVDVPGEVRALLERLASPESPQRAHAAALLGDMGEKAAPAVAHLLATLTDENRQVRRRAAEALGKIGDSHAVDSLIAVLGDRNEDWGVRCGAAVALGELRDARAVKPLTGVLADMVSHVRLTAVIALGEIGDLAAEEAVVGTAQYDSDTRVRQAAEETLRRLAARQGNREDTRQETARQTRGDPGSTP